MRPILLTAAVAAAALAAPATAAAHVTLQPKEATAGSYTRLDVRVPTERDNASTTKVDIQFPPGFASASYEPVPGWTVKVTKVKLAKPIKTDDGEITEGVGRISWTADSRADGIPPGAFQDFGLSVRVPGKAGDKLTFKALQTYSNGEIVRWIGAPDSDTPAPIVTVTAAGTSDRASATPTAAATPATTGAAPSDGSDTLTVIALIVGALGLAAGVVSLLSARRGRIRAAA
jgi:periplasmic copper chaperone A